MEILFASEVYSSAFRIFFNFFLVSVIISILISILLQFVLNESEKQPTATLFMTIFTVVLLGGLTGYAGGNSRVGVVGDIIPAVLTFLGGSFIYIFGVRAKFSILIAFLVSAFVVSLFIGYGMGAKKRHLFEIREGRKEVCISVFRDPHVMGNEAALNTAIKLFGKKCEKVVDIKNITQLNDASSKK